jgi:hypothetical protein
LGEPSLLLFIEVRPAPATSRRATTCGTAALSAKPAAVVYSRHQLLTRKGTPVSLAQPTNNEATILDRLLAPERPALTREAAESILALEFGPEDKARLDALAARARAGTLTPEEQREIDAYSRVGSLVSILTSKARLSLKGHPAPFPP